MGEYKPITYKVIISDQEILSEIYDMHPVILRDVFVRFIGETPPDTEVIAINPNFEENK